MFGLDMWIIWAILMVIFLVVEAFTLGLTTVWCAVGCIVAGIMDLCGASLTAQIIAMITVSVISFILCMVLIRPIIDTKSKSKEPTNADRVIGQEAFVIKAIDPIEGKGQVKVMGQVWSAKASKDIPEKTRVKIVALEGVKLVVEEVKE